MNEKRSNDKLRYEREIRGWSQKKVADQIDVGKEMISRWECGERFPSKYYQEKLCQLYNKSTSELGFMSQSNAVASTPSKSSDPALLLSLAQQDIQSIPPIFSQAISQGIMGTVHELEGADVDTLRRKLLEQAFGTVATFYALPNPDPLERLVRAIKKSASIDDTLLAHLEMITRNNLQLFIRSQKSVLMLPSILRHLETITQLLEHSFPEHVHNLLCTFAGETTQLIGDILFNAGDNSNAEKYYKASLEASKEAANEVLYAVTLGRKSFIPIYSGDPQIALPLLRKAHEIVRSTSSDVIDAWLWAIEAEVHANIGDANACSKALEQSELFIERDRSGEVSYLFADTSYPPFTSSHLLGYKGACSLKLHMTSKAQEFLEARLASIEEGRSHKKSIVLVDLATVYAQRGEIEEACKYTRQALDIITQTKSARVFQRVLNHRVQLDPWRKIPDVKNLDASIENVLPHIKIQGGI